MKARDHADDQGDDAKGALEGPGDVIDAETGGGE